MRFINSPCTSCNRLLLFTDKQLHLNHLIKTKSIKYNLYQEINMPISTIDCWVCTRCKYKWQIRKDGEENLKPVTCPRCRNPFWDKPKVRYSRPKKKEEGKDNV